MFWMDNPEYGIYVAFRFRITTNSPSSLAMTFHYRNLYTAVKYQVIFGVLVLAFVYVLIVFEVVHRTIAALIGSFICVSIYSSTSSPASLIHSFTHSLIRSFIVHAGYWVHVVLHERPTFEAVISWIDFQTVGLLFGMMIMVGIFSNTGFFEYSAVKAYKLSRGNMWYLTVILCTFTGCVSAFLDNVTTILLIAPVTMRLCRVLEVAPEPLLIAEVMFSNIGGTATPIGDPPNIIIVNDPRVMAHPDINFGTFTLHAAPGVILAAIVVFCYLYILQRVRQLSLSLSLAC